MNELNLLIKRAVPAARPTAISQEHLRFLLPPPNRARSGVNTGLLGIMSAREVPLERMGRAEPIRDTLPDGEIPVATEALVALLYSELRRLAESRLRDERDGHTLTPTALVSEVYLRLARENHPWQSRAHFFSAAAKAMKRILVDHHRRRAAIKRGGGTPARGGDLIDQLSIPEADLDFDALDEALGVLERVDPDVHQVIMLRYFAGLSTHDVAEMVGATERTVTRRWNMGRTWLLERLTAQAHPEIRATRTLQRGDNGLA